MKKKIISVLCTAAMSLAMVEPIFAADTLYTEFKNTALSGLRALFLENFSSFDIGNDYSDSKKSLIILEAWQNGLKDSDSFDGVKAKVNEAADKLDNALTELESTPNTLAGVTIGAGVLANSADIGTTDPNNTFKIGDQEFILIKTEGQGDDKLFYVMAKDLYGTGYIDAQQKGRWSDELSNTIPYVLTNQMAFGVSTGNITKSLPENILKHIDVMHIWDIEPNAEQTNGTKVVAPLSLISMKEYSDYASVIGKDDTTDTTFWTRTPVKKDLKVFYSVKKASMTVRNEVKSQNALSVRPVFYLKSSFFKEEKMEKCGGNVILAIDDVVTENDISDLYGNKKDDVFEISINPFLNSTDAMVGTTVSADYKQPENIPLKSVQLQWERSKDNKDWEEIEGATEKSYKVARADSGYYLRVKMKPQFDMGAFSDGSLQYTDSIGPVTTADSIYMAVAGNLAEMKKIFSERFSDFTISSDGYQYNLPQKNMIILKVWQQGFTSFDDLDQKVTEAAAELKAQIGKGPSSELAEMYPDYAKGYSQTRSLKELTTTSKDNLFKIGGKEFIFLKTVEIDGKEMVYVMAKDSYISSVAVDGTGEGRWDDTFEKSLAYKMTNQMAFRETSSGIAQLPEEIIKHLDVMHIWDVEAGSRTNFTGHHVYVAPISVISITEYINEFEGIIGTDGLGTFWTRTPVKGAADQYYAIGKEVGVFKTMKTKCTSGRALRPAFYLDSSFFKEEVLEMGGKNVVNYLDKNLSADEFNKLYKDYSDEQMSEIFGSYSVTALPVSGDTIVGQTLKASYEDGEIKPKEVKITWERSKDKTNWTPISGANSSTYTLTSADNECYIRVVFTPVYDSVVLKNGKPTSAQTEGTVYESLAVKNAIDDINSAIASDNIAEVRNILTEHSALFLCDASETAFSEGAARIFVNEPEVVTVSDVRNLYKNSIELNSLATTTDKATADKNIEKIMSDTAAYSKLSDEQKEIVNSMLFSADVAKTQVKAFIDKAEEIIMLTRFNTAERDDIVNLIKEYASDLGMNITGLSEYQLQIAGTYIAGVDYGTDINALKTAFSNGIAAAKKSSPSSKPSQGGSSGSSVSGFVPPSSSKPEPIGGVSQTIFNDLQSVPWGEAAINSLAQRGILSGTGEGTFEPDRFVTRNEFVKMIVSAFNVERGGSELSFADIDDNSWSAEYIKAAVNAGIIFGVEDNYFGDGMNISRQDVAVIAERILNYKGIELQSSSLTFNDSNEIADYAVSAVAKMNYNKIMNGMDNNLFAPKGTTTRAQAAVVIYNLLNYYESKQAETEEQEEIAGMRNRNDKYELVDELGIVKEEFSKDSKITRGELASALAAFGKYTTDKYEGIFKDVASDHKYSGEIEVVYKNNIMAPMTEKTFAPDEVATYGQAYNAIIASSGHKDAPGGPAQAERALSKEPINASYEDPLTDDMLRKMMFAALEIPVFEYEGSSSLAVSDTTILNMRFDVYKQKGTVNAVAGMAIAGREEQKDDLVIITVGTEDYLYNAGDVDYSEYLGYNVTFYYTEVDGEDKLLSMSATGMSGDQLRLSFEQITDAERNLTSLSYRIKSKTETVRIARDADFIYNGKTCYSITRDDLVPDNGYITLIDTDNNDEYDVIKIENYDYVMVAQIDNTNKTVLNKFDLNAPPYDLNEDSGETEKVNITKNGRYIKMDFISKGDVLAIMASRDGKLINVEVSDKKVSGSVTGTNPGENEIRIDNTTLKTVGNFNFDEIVLGSAITVGLDHNGYAVGFCEEAAADTVLLGYMYKVTPNEADETRVIHMMTEDNEFVRLNTSSVVTDNGTKISQSALDGRSPQLIGYRLDTDGNIKNIFTAVDSSEKNQLVLSASHISDGTEVIYNTFGMVINFEHSFYKSAKVFDVAFNSESGAFDKDNSRVSTISGQPIPQSKKLSGEMDKLLIYNADESNVSGLCVYEHAVAGGNDGALESFNTQAFVINKVFDKYDEKSEEVVRTYKGYHNGAEVEYTMSKKMKDQLGESLSKIKAGDVLLVWLSGKEITRFRRIFAFDSEDTISQYNTDSMCNFRYPENLYEGSEAFKTYEKHDYGNSGANSSGSRMATAYGDVLRIYKSETYTYPVLNMLVAGRETPSSFTLDSSTKIYVYNVRNNTIEVVSSEGVNYAYEKVVVTSRYGNVRDVIIYED